MNNKEIGDRIRKLRQSLNLSQSMVAERVGIKQESYRKYETGETNIFARHLEAIAAALDTDVIGLLTSYDYSDRMRVLEDDIKGIYESKLAEERNIIKKLEQTIRDKEMIIALMQDKLDSQSQKLEKK